MPPRSNRATTPRPTQEAEMPFGETKLVESTKRGRTSLMLLIAMVVWATSPNVLPPPVDESPDQISTSGMKQKEDDSSSRGELSQLRQGTGAPGEASFSEKAEKDGGSAYT